MPDNASKPPDDDPGVSTASSNPIDPPHETTPPLAAIGEDEKPHAHKEERDDEDKQQAKEEDGVDKLVAGVRALHVVQPPPQDAHPQLLRIARLIQDGKVKKIVCMCGAGISVSAGIPDFRTPGTGLYSQLEKYKLPAPEAVFEINFFRRNPQPFYMLAKELWPGNYDPTPTHYFMRLLHDKGLLLRCYTQNIDSLEAQAGLPRTAVVAAHGNFDGAHCARCRKKHDVEKVREAAMQEVPLRCGPTCSGVVKPEIVFFGESLPESFHSMVPLDFSSADLIVMGTSLVVNPFASLIHLVADTVPRLLINREVVGEAAPGSRRGFDFSDDSRDGAFVGDCDQAVQALVQLLGWEAEMQALMDAGPRCRV